jgi:hypothetical protein
MKASEMISNLQSLIAEHGDLDVLFEDNETGPEPANFIYAPQGKYQDCNGFLIE